MASDEEADMGDKSPHSSASKSKDEGSEAGEDDQGSKSDSSSEKSNSSSEKNDSDKEESGSEKGESDKEGSGSEKGESDKEGSGSEKEDEGDDDSKDDGDANPDPAAAEAQEPPKQEAEASADAQQPVEAGEVPSQEAPLAAEEAKEEQPGEGQGNPFPEAANAKQSLPPKASHGPISIPVITQDSINRDTYDLDLLMDPNTQKKLKAGHRFLAPVPSGLERPRSQSPPSSQNFVKANISRMAEKSSLRVSLDNGHMLAGILMHSPPKEPRKEPVDVKHFWAFRTRAQEKTKLLKDEMEKETMEPCSFKPKIIPMGPDRGKRSNEEYYSEMVAYQTRTGDKLKTLKQETEKAEQEVEEEYYHPTLCEKSRKLDSASSGKPRYERLYELHKGKLQNKIKGTAGNEGEEPMEDSLASDFTDSQAVKPFHPVINRRSQNMTRPMPVNEHLYQEASLRAEKMRASQPKARQMEKLISSSSEQLLTEKFQNELDEKWKVLEGNHDDSSYMKFVELLLEMQFIENNPDARSYEQERDLVLRAWNSFGLSADQRVPKRRVEVLLYSIMNFWVPGMAAPEQPPTPAADLASSPPIPEEPLADRSSIEVAGFYTTPAKASKLHTIFRPLYEHRMLKLDKSNIHPTFKFKEELSFKPTLDKTSAKMAEQSRQGRSQPIEEALMSETMKIKERTDQLRLKMEKAEKKECKFKPEVNKKSAKLIGSVQKYSKDTLSIDYIKIRKGNIEATRNEILFGLAAIAQERKKKMEKTPEDIESELNMVECTFAPNLSATREANIKTAKSQNDHWGVDKTIERMKKAREDAQRVKMMTERGFPHTQEIEPVRFTVDHKHKLIPKFDPDKAPEKKVGKPGARSSPKAPQKQKSKPKAKAIPPQAEGGDGSLAVPEHPDNPPIETQGSGPGYSEIRETSSEEVKSEEAEPLLTIAVSLSETEKDNINYYQGDKVEDLARKFVEKHGLPEGDVERLTMLINSKMQEQEQAAE